MAALDHLLDTARDRDREGELASLAVRAHQPQEEQQRLLDRDLTAPFVDEVEPLGSAVEDDAEVRADGGHELLHLPDRLAQQSRAGVGPVSREAVRGHGLHPEWAEEQRQHVRRGREAVVDDETKTARADRFYIEPVEQILCV